MLLKKNQKQKIIKQSKQKQANETDIIQKGTLGLIDLVMPDVLHEEKDYVYMGHKRYTRVYALSGLPRTMYVGYLNDFFSLGNIEITSYVENIPDNTIINTLTTKLSVLISNANIQRKKGNIVDYAEELAISDLEGLREAIQTNRDRMSYSQILIKVYGNNKEDLENKCEYFEDMCARKSIKPRMIATEQTKALISAAPYLKVDIKDNLRSFTTGAVACLIPTGNTELTHKTGIYLGENAYTKSPIFYDQFIGPPVITNPHLYVAGASGAGKSVLLKLIAARSAAAGEWVVILDPEKEYQSLIKHLGGQYIDLRPGMKSGINPLELEVEFDDKGNKFVNIDAKVSDMRELLNTFCEKFRPGEPLNGKELSVIEESVKSLYFEKEITSSPDSLYYDMKEEKDGQFYINKVKKPMPILSDLREKLAANESTASLADTMKLITGDKSMSMFDCHTSIDFNSRIIGINFKDISGEFDKFYAMINVLTWIWAKFSNYRYKTIKKKVVVDEGWYFARSQRSADFLEEIARRGRKYRISLCIATQQISEFLGSVSGKAVINQCATKILMKQEPTVAKEIAEFLDLSARCHQLMTSFSPGQAILRAESELVVLNVRPFDFEWPYVTT